jgi:hypothetical protein
MVWKCGQPLSIIRASQLNSEQSSSFPTRQPELPPNKTLPVSILLEGLSDKDDRADIRMAVSAFKFKQ